MRRSTTIVRTAAASGGGGPSTNTPREEKNRATKAEEHIQYKALLEQVAQLPERQRDAISLRHSGLRFDEVGKLLGCSEDAAKMLYPRALKALKEAAAREGV